MKHTLQVLSDCLLEQVAVAHGCCLHLTAVAPGWQQSWLQGRAYILLALSALPSSQLAMEANATGYCQWLVSLADA